MSGRNWTAPDVLSSAESIATRTQWVGRLIDAARLGLFLEPQVDPRPMLRAAAREVASVAAAAVVLLQLAEDLFADGERDALTDEQQDLLVAVVEDKPRTLVLGGVVELLRQSVAQIVRGPAGEGIRLSVVDERGHSSPSVGARVLVTPDAASPTVGAPTDTPADPFGAGVSVDQGMQKRLLIADLAHLLPGAGVSELCRLRDGLIRRGWRRQL